MSKKRKYYHFKVISRTLQYYSFFCRQLVQTQSFYFLKFLMKWTVAPQCDTPGRWHLINHCVGRLIFSVFPDGFMFYYVYSVGANAQMSVAFSYFHLIYHKFTQQHLQQNCTKIKIKPFKIVCCLPFRYLKKNSES